MELNPEGAILAFPDLQFFHSNLVFRTDMHRYETSGERHATRESE